MELDAAQKRKLLIAFILFDFLVFGAIAVWFLFLRSDGPADDDESGRRSRTNGDSITRNEDDGDDPGAGETGEATDEPAPVAHDPDDWWIQIVGSDDKPLSGVRLRNVDDERVTDANGTASFPPPEEGRMAVRAAWFGSFITMDGPRTVWRADIVPLIVEIVDGRSGIAVAARSVTMRASGMEKALEANGREFRLDLTPYRRGERAEARLVVDAGPGLAAFARDLDATVGRTSPGARAIRMVVPVWPTALVEARDPGGDSFEAPPPDAIGLGGGVAGPEPEKGTSTLVVDVRDAGGRPARLVVVTLNFGPRRWSQVTDEEGIAHFDDLFAGKIELRAFGAEFLPTSRWVTLMPKERKRIEVREAPGRTVLLRVLDANGRPIAATQVVVAVRGAWGYTHVVDGIQYPIPRTDSRGEIRLGPLPIGASMIVISGADSDAAEVTDANETVIRMMTRK